MSVAACVLTTAGSAFAQSTEGHGILVWGRIGPKQIVLEPAIQYNSRPRLPVEPGQHRVRGIDADGREVFSLSFRGISVADGDEEWQFNYFVPLGTEDLDRIYRIELITPWGDVARESAVSAGISLEKEGPATDLEVLVETHAMIRIEWNADAYPLAMIRDGTTSVLLSMARNGTVRIPSKTRELEILLSDGVKTRTQRLTIR